MSALEEKSLEVLRLASDTHGDRLIYSSSMGLESSVMIDLIYRNGLNIPVLTLDTGRLPQATYDVVAAVEKRYGFRVKVICPDHNEVQQMVNEFGVNLFRDSVELRKMCCEIRKVRPFNHALDGTNAWLTGRRREQAKGRADLDYVEVDPVYGRTKYNPLLDWSLKDVWAYVREYDVPYNKLHDMHYSSIGCECCSRAITVGEDERAGRWWWENDDVAAECGLHVFSLKQVSGEIENGEGI